MIEWIGKATKLLGPIAKWALKHWLVEVEMLGAARSVYTYENGTSPYVNLGASIRVHNRNDAPTTLYVRAISAKLASGVDRGIERAVMLRPGPITSIDDFQCFNSYEIPGCSSVELTLSTSRRNPPKLSDWTKGASPEIVLELGETFGNHFKLTAPLRFDGTYPQHQDTMTAAPVPERPSLDCVFSGGAQAVLAVTNNGTVADVWASLRVQGAVHPRRSGIFGWWTHTNSAKTRIARGQTCELLLAKLYFDTGAVSALWEIPFSSDDKPGALRATFSSLVLGDQGQAPDVHLYVDIFSDPDPERPTHYHVVLHSRHAEQVT